MYGREQLPLFCILSLSLALGLAGCEVSTESSSGDVAVSDPDGQVPGDGSAPDSAIMADATVVMPDAGMEADATSADQGMLEPDASTECMPMYQGGWPCNPEKDALPSPAWEGECPGAVGCACGPDENFDGIIEDVGCTSGLCTGIADGDINGGRCFSGGGVSMPRFYGVDQFGERVDLYDLVGRGQHVVLNVMTLGGLQDRGWTEWVSGTGEERADLIRYSMVPEAVSNGSILWVTVIEAGAALEPATEADIAAWYERHRIPSIPILADAEGQLSRYFGASGQYGSPYLVLLSPDMKVLQNGAENSQPVLERIRDLWYGGELGAPAVDCLPVYVGGWPCNVTKDALPSPAWEGECPGAVGCQCGGDADFRGIIEAPICDSGLCTGLADAGESGGRCFAGGGVSMPRFIGVDQYGDEVDLFDLVGRGQHVVLNVFGLGGLQDGGFTDWVSGGGGADRPDLQAYSMIPDIVQRGEVLWVSVLETGVTREPATAEDVALWFEAHRVPSIPILRDSESRLSRYFSAGDIYGSPYLVLLSPDMTVLENGAQDRGPVLDRLRALYFEGEFGCVPEYEGGWPCNPDRDELPSPAWQDECPGGVGCACREGERFDGVVAEPSCASGLCSGQSDVGGDGGRCFAGGGQPMPRFVSRDQFGEEVDLFDLVGNGQHVVLNVFGLGGVQDGNMTAWLSGEGDPTFNPEGFENIPQLVRDGRLLWVSVIETNLFAEPATPQDVSAWYEQNPVPSIPVLSDPAQQLSQYFATGGLSISPYLVLLSPEMTILENGSEDIRTVLNRIIALWNAEELMGPPAE